MADLKSSIEAVAASGIKKVEGDGHSVENFSLADLIEADRYLRAKEQPPGGLPGGIRITRLILPGQVGPERRT